MLASRLKTIGILAVFLCVLYAFSTLSWERGRRPQVHNDGSSKGADSHTGRPGQHSTGSSSPSLSGDKSDGAQFHWSQVPMKYPLASLTPIPRGHQENIPKIQHEFRAENAEQRASRMLKLEAIKSNFTHAWQGYKDRAWLRDEVMPISGGAHDPFGGWAATLVDSLGMGSNDA